MSDQPNPAQAPVFRGAAGHPLTVVPAPAAATNGRVLSLLFDHATVSLQGPYDPLTGVRCTAVSVFTDVAPPGARVRVTHDLRGFVSKGADARITVVADLGGTLATLEYPYGAEVQERIDRTFTTAVELRPDQVYLIPILVSVERRAKDALALVSLDSIDMAVQADEPAGTDHPGDPAGGGT